MGHQEKIELLALVDENDQWIGSMEKLKVHELGLLHRAVSVLVFNDKGECLMQRRAIGKYHSPGLWTNTCCTHPRIDEHPLRAASRRLLEEMGIITGIQPIFSFTYRVPLSNGLIEHEYDHVFTGIYNKEPIPHPSEVMEWRYQSIDSICEELKSKPETYTAWFRILFEKYMEFRTIHSIAGTKADLHFNCIS